MPKLSKKERDNIISTIHKAKGKVTLIAQALDVSRQTFYTYRDSYASIANALEDARASFDESLLDIAEVKLRDALYDGEQWAIKYVLDKKGLSRGYVDAKRHDIGNADGQAFVVEHRVPPLPDDILDNIDLHDRDE